MTMTVGHFVVIQKMLVEFKGALLSAELCCVPCAAMFAVIHILALHSMESHAPATAACNWLRPQSFCLN